MISIFSIIVALKQTDNITAEISIDIIKLPGNVRHKLEFISLPSCLLSSPLMVIDHFCFIFLI